jgi:hypothetical protein
MSLRNRLVLPIVLSSLAVLAGCGSSNTITNPVAPPNGSFSNSNLNGTYVFSVSGVDNATSAPYTIVGAFTANGSGGNGQGGISGGTIDLNDPGVSTPVANASINSSSYSVEVDGRGKATLSTSLPAPFGTIVLDFVLQDSSHGLVTEFDSNGSGSGTLDVQTSGVSPVGTYAFIFSGFDISTGTANLFSTVGNFTLGTGGTISTGLEDFNDNGFGYPAQGLTGQVVLGPSASPATTLITQLGSQIGAETYDVYAISATHLKFIEMDTAGTLSGDAYSQTSTAVPQGNLAFTLAGSYPGVTTYSAAGGFMVTDGQGNITDSSTEDANNSGTVTASPTGFSGNYVAGGVGRFTLDLASFSAGSAYAAYPSSGGLLLLEIDNGLGLMTGVAYPPQTSTTFNGSAGYGLNFTGANLTQGVEVDDIAEFASSSTGLTVTGIVDENWAPGGSPNYGLALSGTYTTPDGNGRGMIGATAGTSSNTTLNGGFDISFYSVDGTTYPFIETDTNDLQVTAGVFFTQDASASAAAAATRPHMFAVRPLIRPNAAHWRKK